MLFLKLMQIIESCIKMNKSRASRDSVSVVDFNSEVCDKSLNRYGWPQRKKSCKNS